jgi:16S rRNA (guanine527-N7)-methyltransferase
MLLARGLAERAAQAGIQVGDLELDQLERYLRLLAQWNDVINLTALSLDGFPPKTLDRLVLEPLAASQLVPQAASAWIDVGSGGGSPAIPLKIVRRSLALTMVEARSRKAAFLREAIRVLDLPATTVVTSRFEELAASSPSTSDLISARAIRTDPALMQAVELALRVGGNLLLFRSRRAPPIEVKKLRLDRESTLPDGGAVQLWAKTP